MRKKKATRNGYLLTGHVVGIDFIHIMFYLLQDGCVYVCCATCPKSAKSVQKGQSVTLNYPILWKLPFSLES